MSSSCATSTRDAAGVQQTWTCKATATRVLIAHEDDILQFEMGGA